MNFIRIFTYINNKTNKKEQFKKCKGVLKKQTI